MTIEEANKIIAEFMGYELIEQPCSMGRNPFNMTVKNKWEFEIKAYSKSLDALVPVWEKLNIDRFVKFSGSLSRGIVGCENLKEFLLLGIFGEGKTIQEAACIATAKAIKELNES